MSKENLIRDSLKLINEKKFAEALQNLQDVSEKDANIYFLIGSIYISIGKLDLAEENLKESEKLNNRNFSVFHNLGIIAGIKKNFESAKINFLKAIEINENIDSLSELGRIYSNENNFDEALKYFEKVLTKDPNHKKTNLRVGNMYFQMNEHKRGLKYIQKATGLIRFTNSGIEIIQ